MSGMPPFTKTAVWASFPYAHHFLGVFASYELEVAENGVRVVAESVGHCLE